MFKVNIFSPILNEVPDFISEALGVWRVTILINYSLNKLELSYVKLIILSCKFITFKVNFPSKT